MTSAASAPPDDADAEPVRGGIRQENWPEAGRAAGIQGSSAENFYRPSNGSFPKKRSRDHRDAPGMCRGIHGKVVSRTWRDEWIVDVQRQRWDGLPTLPAKIATDAAAAAAAATAQRIPLNPHLFLCWGKEPENQDYTHRPAPLFVDRAMMMLMIQTQAGISSSADASAKRNLSHMPSSQSKAPPPGKSDGIFLPQVGDDHMKRRKK